MMLGYTALHIASACNYTEKLSYLMSCPGADVNEPDDTGRTPLHAAVSSEARECVKVTDSCFIKPN